MVRKHRVPAIARGQPRHVTRHTIAAGRGMRFLQRRAVTIQTALSKVRSGVRRFLMRIMATPAPQLPAARSGADAQGELLRVADHFQSLAGRLRRHINGIRIFDGLARLEIRDFLSRIRDAHFSREMTLLADTVSRGIREFR